MNIQPDGLLIGHITNDLLPLYGETYMAAFVHTPGGNGFPSKSRRCFS